MSVQPFLFTPDGNPWIEIKDGNPSAIDIFKRHYTAKSMRKIEQFIGPGFKMALITADAKAIFAWRNEKYRMDGQEGVNCTVFRNEGSAQWKSSELIRFACILAWDRWGLLRLFTFVDAAKVRHKRDPGRCFIRAGFRLCGKSKSGKLIFERLPS